MLIEITNRIHQAICLNRDLEKIITYYMYDLTPHCSVTQIQYLMQL